MGFAVIPALEGLTLISLAHYTVNQRVVKSGPCQLRYSLPIYDRTYWKSSFQCSDLLSSHLLFICVKHLMNPPFPQHVFTLALSWRWIALCRGGLCWKESVRRAGCRRTVIAAASSGSDVPRRGSPAWTLTDGLAFCHFLLRDVSRCYEDT